MIGVDIETTGLNPRKDKIVAICVHRDGRTTIYDRYSLGKKGLKAAMEEIADKPTVYHNAKFDVAFIWEDLGVKMTEAKCTYIMSKVLQNGKDFENSLVNCLHYYLGVSKDIHKDKDGLRKNFSYKRPLTTVEREYISADTEHLVPLYEKLDRMIADGNFQKVVALEEALLPILIEIESKGVRIDTTRLAQLVKRWKQALKVLVGMLDKEQLALYPQFDAIQPLFVTTNYNSTNDVIALFKSLGLPGPTKYHPKEKEWRYSIEYDALGEYLAAHPDTKMRGFIGLLLRYKEYEKLRSTYGDALLDLVDDHGFLHTTYRQIDTDTARLSSSKPNLQNIGNSGPGATVRNCFLPDQGHLIVDVDMDAAEIRIAADKSQDRLLVDAILHGADMHSVLASKIFSTIASEEVTITKSKEPMTIKGLKVIPSKLRDFSKTGHFARLYKGGAGRMKTVYADYLFNLAPIEEHDEICKGIVRVLDESMPGLTQWANDQIARGREKGFLREPKLGRIRYFSQDEYGSICNYPIQCTNAEAMKTAIIRAHKYLTATGYGRILMTIHDQLVISAVADKAQEVLVEIEKIMRESIGWFLDSIPGGASGKITKVFEK